MLHGQIEQRQPCTTGRLFAGTLSTASEPLEPNTVCVSVSTSIGEPGNQKSIDLQAIPSG